MDNQTDLGNPVLLGAIGATALGSGYKSPTSQAEDSVTEGSAVGDGVSPSPVRSVAAAAEVEEEDGGAGLLVRVLQSAPSPGGVDAYELIEVMCAAHTCIHKNPVRLSELCRGGDPTGWV